MQDLGGSGELTRDSSIKIDHCKLKLLIAFDKILMVFGVFVT